MSDASGRTSTGSAGPVYAFVGNPNCGKTTLFNGLTGMRQKVGNYPGVTVEKKVGQFYSQHGHPIQVIDLPGAYSLVARSPDEAILRDVLLGRRSDMDRPDRVVCVVDASNLERNLYLVTQVLELGLPTIVVLNMMDQVAGKGLSLDREVLEAWLGVPVLACQANTGEGLLALRVTMSRAVMDRPRSPWTIPDKIRPAIDEISAALEGLPGRERLTGRAEAVLMLSEQEHVRVMGSRHVGDKALDLTRTWEVAWEAEGYDWRGEIVASRYEAIAGACARALRLEEEKGATASEDRKSVV